MRKTKKKILLLSAIAAIAASGALALGCSSVSDGGYKPFAAPEFDVENGTTVKLPQGSAKYELIGDVPDGVTVSEGGVFTVSAGAHNGAQVVLAARVDGKIVSTAVCRVTAPVDRPQITFTGLSEYLLSGGRVVASASPAAGITYTLKTPVDGVTIDPVSGRVRFTQIVEDATEFTVVATAGGSGAERTFRAAVGDLIVAENDVQIAEYGVGGEVKYTVYYGDGTGSSAIFEQLGVAGVAVSGKNLEQGVDYTYDAATRTVTIAAAATVDLGMGENTVSIYTAKNEVTATLKMAKYIRTAQQLADIRKTKEALAGYYALANDIDLSDYLAETDGGDEEAGTPGKKLRPYGWQPIGTYADVTDGTALDYAFRGTFDGLGHTVSGLWIDWTEAKKIGMDVAQWYNAGLFGYVTLDGVIRNLKLVGEADESSYMCSYSGGLVGVNCGLVENCLVNVCVVTEKEHHVAGGFVGRNEGTIRNCISLGWASSGSGLGAFAGSNIGKIQSCHAVDDPAKAKPQSIFEGRPQLLPFAGVTGNLIDCTVYSSEQELVEGADFSGWAGWTTHDGELPSIVVTHLATQTE